MTIHNVPYKRLHLLTTTPALVDKHICSHQKQRHLHVGQAHLKDMSSPSCRCTEQVTVQQLQCGANSFWVTWNVARFEPGTLHRMQAQLSSKPCRPMLCQSKSERSLENSTRQHRQLGNSLACYSSRRSADDHHDAALNTCAPKVPPSWTNQPQASVHLLLAI